MLERLTNTDSIKNAELCLRELIDAHGEWFYAEASGANAIALRGSECDFRAAHGRLIFSCWSNEGASVWNIVAWEWTGEKLLLEAMRRMGRESATLELVPRARAQVLSATVSAARRKRCERLAQLALSELRGARVERASLSAGAGGGRPGKYARIVMRLHRERIAVAGVVAAHDENDRGDADAFLSSALVWFARAVEKANAPFIEKLWLVAPSQFVEPLAERIALLRVSLRRAITLYEINEAWQELAPVRQKELAELWTPAPKRLVVSRNFETSEESARIVALAPEAIDVVRARHGETLRFHGLPFARVRRVLETTQMWFGVEGKHKRRLLDESNAPECWKLIEELQAHRRANSSDHSHALYKAAPEAWLESSLRRNVTRLDPGLVIAPLHAQFRTSQGAHAGARPVDLLALRRDGRLVVIELKVSEDREHVLQGADYWRRIELYRRHGHIAEARLFGDAVIADESPLVYLVAPMLRFHRAFETLARAVTPEVEIYRFDINEDWRAGVRVVRRERVN